MASSDEWCKLCIAIASIILFIVSCILYIILHRLDKLRYGDDEVQFMDKLVIVLKILAALVIVSQFWLYDYGDFGLVFFLVGALLLYICFRGSFSEANDKERGLYASLLAGLLFAAGSCFAVIYYSAYKLNDKDNPELFLKRLLFYGVACVVSKLVAFGLHLYNVKKDRTTTSASSKQVELLPSPATLV